MGEVSAAGRCAERAEGLVARRREVRPRQRQPEKKRKETTRQITTEGIRHFGDVLADPWVCDDTVMMVSQHGSRFWDSGQRLTQRRVAWHLFAFSGVSRAKTKLNFLNFLAPKIKN